MIANWVTWIWHQGVSVHAILLCSTYICTSQKLYRQAWQFLGKKNALIFTNWGGVLSNPPKNIADFFTPKPPIPPPITYWSSGFVIDNTLHLPEVVFALDPAEYFMVSIINISNSWLGIIGIGYVKHVVRFPICIIPKLRLRNLTG